MYLIYGHCTRLFDDLHVYPYLVSFSSSRAMPKLSFTLWLKCHNFFPSAALNALCIYWIWTKPRDKVTLQKRGAYSVDLVLRGESQSMIMHDYKKGGKEGSKMAEEVIMQYVDAPLYLKKSWILIKNNNRTGVLRENITKTVIWFPLL